MEIVVSQDVHDVKLEPDNRLLEEVVVTGYGSTKNSLTERVTGSVARYIRGLSPQREVRVYGHASYDMMSNEEYGNFVENRFKPALDEPLSTYGPTRLELVKSSLKLLVNNLRDKDCVAIVVYAGSAGEVLPSTPGNDKQKIREALDNLTAGGSTAGGAGIKLAYNVAKKNFINGTKQPFAFHREPCTGNREIIRGVNNSGPLCEARLFFCFVFFLLSITHHCAKPLVESK
ncbi:hypothetical protein FACS1894174_00080 [Bacteroidia bacterium]|nr:hypothetical protein FACS1894155_09110 [Bacteroidia bacterium]GHV19696.1 hypothetical protein FACS1894174_00080 [Bacteroidia bacterium]